MLIFIGEFDDLILNRRTIAGPHTLDYASIKGRFMQIGFDEFLCLEGRIGDVTRYLLPYPAQDGSRRISRITESGFCTSDLVFSRKNIISPI